MLKLNFYYSFTHPVAEHKHEEELIAKLEEDLVETITKEGDLMESHMLILKLAENISEAQSKRKVSLMQQVSTTEGDTASAT